MAVNIFGALDGLRPKALMLAKLPAAKTAHGPRTHKAKIIDKATFLLIWIELYASTALFFSPAELLTGLVYFSSIMIVTVF